MSSHFSTLVVDPANNFDVQKRRTSCLSDEIRYEGPDAFISTDVSVVLEA